VPYRVRKIASCDQTGERWVLYEIEVSYGTDLEIQWREPVDV